MDKDNFNKLQYSKFVGQNQFVVRSNDKAEFIELVTFIDDFIVKLPKETTIPKNAQPMPLPAPIMGQAVVPGTCNKCGAPEAISKAGKKYCSAKCWLNNQKTY